MTSFSQLKQKLSGARVIVTGASGFIGLNIVNELVRLDAEVLVIDRIQSAHQLPNVEFEWVDLRHLNKVYEADYLIHLAAISNAGYAEKYPLDSYEVNVLGTVNLLNHVRINNRVFFPSTALIYQNSEQPITEEGELNVSSTYAQTKAIGEQVIKFHCDRMQVDHTLVRFFNIFGPGQLPMYIVPQVLRQILEDGHITLRNGAVIRDLLYVDDCIDAVLKLVVEPKAANTVFNIGSSNRETISDIAHAAIDVSGRQDVEITDLEENIQYSPTAIIADTSKLQSIIDWRPKTSLRDGLKVMWDSNTGQ